jgi:hypothetical protein
MAINKSQSYSPLWSVYDKLQVVESEQPEKLVESIGRKFDSALIYSQKFQSLFTLLLRLIYDQWRLSEVEAKIIAVSE